MPLLKRFLKQTDGNVAMLTGALLVAMCGLAAISVDYALALATKAELQATAEAAAMAGAASLPTETNVDNAAIAIAKTNLPVAKFGNVVVASDVVLGNYNSGTGVFTAAGAPVNAVRVVARRATANSNAMPTIFAPIFGVSKMDISVTAIAGSMPTPACILALSNNSPKAFHLDSNANLDLKGCEVVVNSTHNLAMSVDSNAKLKSDNNCVAGDYEQKSNSVVTPTPKTGCTPAADPYASLPLPSSSGCTYNNVVINGTTGTLNPGIYCNGIQIKSNAVVTMNPGNYIIKDSAFLVDSNSHLTGSGVMVHTTSNSYLDFDSNTVITLSAPTSGPYSGILFFQDPANTQQSFFDSNSANNLTGVLYFPKAKVKFDSNVQMTALGSCTQIVAWEIEFNSNAGLKMDYKKDTCPNGVKSAASGGLTLLM
jgi:Flp pilus assembly protein TadG